VKFQLLIGTCNGAEYIERERPQVCSKHDFLRTKSSKSLCGSKKPGSLELCRTQRSQGTDIEQVAAFNCLFIVELHCRVFPLVQRYLSGSESCSSIQLSIHGSILAFSLLPSAFGSLDYFEF